MDTGVVSCGAVASGGVSPLGSSSKLLPPFYTGCSRGMPACCPAGCPAWHPARGRAWCPSCCPAGCLAWPLWSPGGWEAGPPTRWAPLPPPSCGSFLKITGVFLSSPQALAAVQPEASFLTGPKGCVQHPAPPGSAQTRRRWVAAGWLMTVGSLSPALPWPFSSQGWSTERARLSPQ